MEQDLYNYDRPKIDEQSISHIPALDVLKKIGYKLIDNSVAQKMRGSSYNVILKGVLKEQLKKINHFEAKGQIRSFSDKNIEKAVDDLNIDLTNGLVRTNEEIYKLLMHGGTYSEFVDDSAGKRSYTINYIDWLNFENNIFHVVSEFNVAKLDNRGSAQPDIVLFINGIPFAVIECKSSSISIDEGISQTLRNQKPNYIPQLFKYVQVVMATNASETKYATVHTPKKFWSVWKEDEESADIKWHKSEVSKAVKGRMATKQDKDLISLFSPKRVLDFFKYCLLFDKGIKKIARHQQYFALTEIISHIEQKDMNGNRQSGVIWHTQGSGKSLTMVMVTKYLLEKYRNINPKILVVTDRIELDKQIHGTFSHTKVKASRATTGSGLVNLIQDKEVSVITTLVHKFKTVASDNVINNSKDIFILVDESHRSQSNVDDSFHSNMRKTFPNACFLAFTGTPLMKKKGRDSTFKIFGRKYIHKYTIKDAVEDKAIVPLVYEGRYVEQDVQDKIMDKRIELITAEMTETEANSLKQKWARFKNIASSEQRLRFIAMDIYTHFTKHYNDGFSKAMLTVSRKRDAITMKRLFEELGYDKTEVVISKPDTREGNEQVDEPVDNKVQSFWNEKMKQYGDETSYEEQVRNDFVYGEKGESIELLIVVDKLLTGFDAPSASVLYVDKNLKEHSLLQAIARVNRLYEGKDFGLIIDYHGLGGNLGDALNIYSGLGLDDFDDTDLEGTLIDILSIAEKLESSYKDLINIFKNIKNKNDLEEYSVLLDDENLREQFYEKLSYFSRNLKIAISSPKIAEKVNNRTITIKHYKNEFKFYQNLRKSVKLRYSDEIDFKEYEKQMQSIMDTCITSNDIIQVVEPVDILSKDFDSEIEQLKTDRAKADAIATRLTKHIGIVINNDPAYYKKFSDKIKQIIEEYRGNRIDEADYFSKMQDLKREYKEGKVYDDYPTIISKDTEAKVYYGILGNFIASSEHMVSESESEQICLDDNTRAIVAKKISEIIKNNIKVDWKHNSEVQNNIKRDIKSMFFESMTNNELPSQIFNLIDGISREVVKTAISRSE